MRYKITGKQIEIGEALQTHVRDEVDGIVSKYAQRPTDANVIFSRDAHEYVCEIILHLSTGLTARAKAHDVEIYPCFDKCAEKLAKQLRRYKRRLRDHGAARRSAVELTEAAAYILAPDQDEEDNGHEADAPVIVAETRTHIPTLSVGEAVMHMELANAPVFVFREEKGKALNVVYRRDDGNIGWIEPQS